MVFSEVAKVGYSEDSPTYWDTKGCFKSETKCTDQASNQLYHGCADLWDKDEMFHAHMIQQGETNEAHGTSRPNKEEHVGCATKKECAHFSDTRHLQQKTNPSENAASASQHPKFQAAAHANKKNFVEILWRANLNRSTELSGW